MNSSHPSSANDTFLKLAKSFQEDPNNMDYEFFHLFNSVVHPSNRARDPSVHDSLWQEAISSIEAQRPEIYELLWPVKGMGFREIVKRLQQQDESIASDEKRLDQLRENVEKLRSYCDGSMAARVKSVTAKNKLIQSRVLNLVRKVQALEMKGKRKLLNAGELQLVNKLKSLVGQVIGPQGGLPKRLQELLPAVQMEAKRQSGADAAVQFNMDNGQMEQLQGILKNTGAELAGFIASVKKSARDIDILTSQLKDEGSRKRAGESQPVQRDFHNVRRRV